MNFKKLISLAILIAAGIAAAQPPKPPTPNEDVQFIAEWRRAQNLAELAEALQLDDVQARALDSMKAELDAIHADAAARREAEQHALAATAAGIRARLEAGEAFADGDEAALRDHFHALNDIRRNARAVAVETVSGIGALLTEAQSEILRGWLRSRKPERGLGPADSRFGAPIDQTPGSARHAPPPRRGHGRGFQAPPSAAASELDLHEQARRRILVRTLLDDAFLNQL